VLKRRGISSGKFISLQLRFCKTSVTKAMCLFPRTKFGANIPSHRGSASKGQGQKQHKKVHMPNNKSGALARRPLWIITRYQNNWIDALTMDSHVEGSFLAVFSFEEEAEAFLRLLGDKEKQGWECEPTTKEGLVSVLLGPCEDVKGVVLDPLPLLLGRELLPLVSVKRELFFQCLLEEHGGLETELAPSPS
jgi:hypothetical protein